MARRGEELRNHILWVAKDVFQEMGFERTSMDLIAVRAATSKRTLYAYFQNKDTLFLAVVELVRELYLGALGAPDHYSDDPLEAVILFCGRFAQLLLRVAALRTWRLGIAEAERLPRASARYHETVFVASHERLAGFLAEQFPLAPAAADDIAQELLGRVIYPRLIGALLGVERPIQQEAADARIASVIDLDPIRRAAERLLLALPRVVGDL